MMITCGVQTRAEMDSEMVMPAPDLLQQQTAEVFAEVDGSDNPDTSDNTTGAVLPEKPLTSKQS